MADNRFNQAPGYAGGGGRGYNQFGPQNTGMHGVPRMAPYMQSGMPMNPVMQQQMMMASGMRFPPMQGMRMGPPNTPPPPYSGHSPSPGVAGLPNRPRTSLNKTKGGPQKSEKERFYEEQRQKLKQFGKPGVTKVDADKLIGSFSADTKPQQLKGKVSNTPVQSANEEEDDGFGDFLRAAAATPPDMGEKSEVPSGQGSIESAHIPEPAPEPPEEKKDLKSMMLEYSDLSAPKKAKGFHKPTLNEVQKTGHGPHKVNAASFHESDHSRRWKANTEDLEGLFQLPVAPKPTPAQAVAASQPHHVVYAPQHVMAMPPASGVPFAAGSVAPAPPTGPPPTYSDVAGMPAVGATATNLVASNHASTPIAPVSPVDPAYYSGDPAHPVRGPAHLPEWCSHTEEQVPPVYKQVWEASLVEGKIATERLYPILLLSGLPREKLAQIWSLCNTTTPGQLIKNELWMVLALIALTQNNYSTMSLEILARCPVAPVPLLAAAQDTSTPATLPTTPLQHVPHPAHPTTVPSSGPPTVPGTISSGPPPQPQHHQVQQPRPIPATPAMLASTAGIPAADDDDFADFQTATPAPSSAPVASSKDEGYGEFIGGGANFGRPGNGPSSSPATLPIHTHMGNGAVAMGNGSHQLQSLHHQPPPTPPQPPHPPQPPLSQPAQLSLATLPVDDKYGTNVRSFFCSSDSSTGHTSPSFEDDDLTDDRGSLSQVSTSEQSENEDLRNFESYVEEFNQKKEQPDGSPLHCPFPTIQQKQAMKTARGPTASGQPVLPVFTLGSAPSSGINKQYGPGSSVSSTPVHGTQPDLSQDSSSSVTVSQADSDFADFKSASVSSNTHTVLATTPVMAQKGNNQDDDFADFKSATVQQPTLSEGASSNDVSLMGDEDKYGALRVLELETDLTKPSLFESTGHGSVDSATGDSGNQKTDGAEEGDDWADFSSASTMINNSETGPAELEASGTTDSGIGLKRSGNKEDILKLFNTSSPARASSVFTSGNSSEVTSEAGSKSGSLFGDDPSSSSTPSVGGQMGSSLSGDLPSSSSLTNPDSSFGGAGWGKPDSGPSEDWASFSSAGGDTGQLHTSNLFNSATDLEVSGITKANQSGFGVTGELSPLDKATSHVTAGEDDWGDFSHSSTAASVSHHQPPLGNLSSGMQPEGDDWSDFSTAGREVTEEDGDAAGANGNFVTIKKQNLGTNEIMGLFKVRDDPATLSSYQLPPQPAPNKTATTRQNRRSSGGSHGGRKSSDFDDDMGPPPMDFGMDDDYDDHTFSRGYDLDDFMQRGPPITTYSPFGGTHTSPVYSRAGGLSKLKENKEDDGSVNSLELPSTKAADPSGSDSQSVSSADLTSSETAGNGGVGAGGAESKSLDSLDLKSEPVDSETNDGSNREEVLPQSSAHHHPIRPQELLESMPDFADKYNIDHEAQGSDRYGYQWERCLSNCFQIISEANTLFNTISSSSVCNEVLKSSQGTEYVMSVIEIYRVVCRVMTTMRSTAISTNELEQTLKNIDLAWNNLAAFLVGATLLPEQNSLVFTNALLKSDSDQAKLLACGLCLLNVDSKPLVTTSSVSASGPASVNTCKLTYAGRQYHATCANFWVNCVDQTLPSLTLPELL